MMALRRFACETRMQPSCLGPDLVDLPRRSIGKMGEPEQIQTELLRSIAPAAESLVQNRDSH